MRIPRSEIKTEHVYGLVGVLIALRNCCFQVENLDQIIMVIKKLAQRSVVNYTPIVALEDYTKAK
jgi:hypothetical protein